MAGCDVCGEHLLRSSDGWLCVAGGLTGVAGSSSCSPVSSRSEQILTRSRAEQSCHPLQYHPVVTHQHRSPTDAYMQHDLMCISSTCQLEHYTQ